MKLQKNPVLLPGLMLILGLAALGLRTGLYRFAVDEKGLLVPGTLWEIALWVVTGAACALTAWVCVRHAPNRDPLLEGLGELLAAVGILLCLPELYLTAASPLAWVSFALALAGGGGLAASAVARLRGKTPHVLGYAVACAFFVVNLVARYRVWVSHPQLQDYLFPLLGGIDMLVFCYLRCVPGRIRIRRVVGLTGGFCCLAAIANSGLTPLYLGCGLWLLTNFDAPGDPV